MDQLGQGGIPVLPGATATNALTQSAIHWSSDHSRCVQSDFSSTILNYGLERTSPYLATSQSQIQTWLSHTTNTAGTDLSLTSTPSVAGSGGQSEIASAGPVAGAGEPASGSNRNGGLGTLRGRSEPAARTTTRAGRTLSIGWRQPKVLIE